MPKTYFLDCNSSLLTLGGGVTSDSANETTPSIPSTIRPMIVEATSITITQVLSLYSRGSFPNRIRTSITGIILPLKFIRPII